MRIIGNIEHPSLKISIFKNDGRLSVKFENPLYEQTFKFGDDERFQHVEDVQRLVDEAFIRNVQAQFQGMHQNRISALARLSSPDVEQFEEII